MATRTLNSEERAFLKKLGRKIEQIILDDMGYSSLDAFCLEHHDSVSKPTLYGLCDGKRDFQYSTMNKLCSALGIKLHDLLNI